METIKMAFSAILGNKGRSFLTMLGVIIGVVSVTVLIAIGEGATSSVTDSISSMGTNLLTANIQTRRVGWGRPGSNNRSAGARVRLFSSLTMCSRSRKMSILKRSPRPAAAA